METTRQLKVAKQIQKDVGDIFLREGNAMFPGIMVSVTSVRVSPDLSFAKIFISVFPFAESERVLAAIGKNNWMIRKALGGKIKHQLKQVPELAFQIDDSLEYIENIDNLLKN